MKYFKYKAERDDGSVMMSDIYITDDPMERGLMPVSHGKWINLGPNERSALDDGYKEITEKEAFLYLL